MTDKTSFYGHGVVRRRHYRGDTTEGTLPMGVREKIRQHCHLLLWMERQLFSLRKALNY